MIEKVMKHKELVLLLIFFGIELYYDPVSRPMNGVVAVVYYAIGLSSLVAITVSSWKKYKEHKKNKKSAYIGSSLILSGLG